MEAVSERGNLWLAYDRVTKNKGAAGVDGIGIAEFKEHLKQHWPSIKAKLLAGEYMPRTGIRRVDISKPQAGVRTFGSPPDADGSTDPASVVSSATADLRGGILRIELWLPTWEERPSSGQGGVEICSRRPQGCGRYGLGEILRPR